MQYYTTNHLPQSKRPQETQLDNSIYTKIPDQIQFDSIPGPNNARIWMWDIDMDKKGRKTNNKHASTVYTKRNKKTKDRET
jgi:hypothetical protein